MRVRSFVVLLLLSLDFGGSAKHSFVWWTTNRLNKVRPSDVPHSTPKSVALNAASNEFESFQIVLRSDSDAMTGVDVEMSDLAGPAGSVISNRNVTIYFET